MIFNLIYKSTMMVANGPRVMDTLQIICQSHNQGPWSVTTINIIQQMTVCTLLYFIDIKNNI